MKTYVHLCCLAQVFLEREMFHTKVVEKMKTHFIFIKFFFPENRVIYEIL